MFPKDDCDLLNEAIAQVKRRITVVRIAVAKFESTPVTNFRQDCGRVGEERREQ
jgi:hypothetical protein